MAAELETPVDKFTGLPLPLAPPSLATSYNISTEVDWHHHFHPRLNPLLLSGGGLAVRKARVQLANYNTHHLDYHNCYAGPPLPETEPDQFDLVVFATAGYIPEEAVYFRRGKPYTTHVTAEQRTAWWQSGHIKPESPGTIHNFMIDFARSQPLDHVGEQTLDEFITTMDPARRHYLGNLLLAKRVERATEPIDFAYRLAWKRGLIRPGLPAKPSSFVLLEIGQLRRKRLIKEMAKELTTSLAS